MPTRVVPPDPDEGALQRTAAYVDDVLTAVDSLPGVFLQRRSRSRHRLLRWFGWVTMPGNRQLTRLFVARQLGTNLRRIEAEVGLAAVASGQDDATAKRYGTLATTVGAKTSKLIPVAIVLATIGLAVSLLSVAVPALREEADLLGSMPKVVVNLDGATIADNATAFDDNLDTFSPRDFQGVFNAILLGVCVVFVLFAVLAGSAHAASSILRDPDRYDRRAPFRDAVRDGPATTQRWVFGRHPAKIFLPVTMDVVRNAALYSAILMAVATRRIQGFAAESLTFLEIERVGGPELAGVLAIIAFPAVLLLVYLVQILRHRGERESRHPVGLGRVTLGAALALIAGWCLVVAVALALDVRLTRGPDLWVYSVDDFISLDQRDEFAAVDGVTVQSLAWYPIDVVTSTGPVAATLVVTELGTVQSLVEVDELQLAASEVRADEELQLGEGEGAPQVWVSDALRARLDQSSGDLIELQLDETDRLPLGIATVTFEAAASDELVVLLDVEDRPEGLEDLLIDDLLVRATGGPMHDGSAAKRALLDLADRNALEVIDLRREPVTDRSPAVVLAVVGVGLLALAVLAAFGAWWRRPGAGGRDRSAPWPPPGPPPHLAPPPGTPSGR